MHCMRAIFFTDTTVQVVTKMSFHSSNCYSLIADYIMPCRYSFNELSSHCQSFMLLLIQMTGNIAPTGEVEVLEGSTLLSYSISFPSFMVQQLQLVGLLHVVWYLLLMTSCTINDNYISIAYILAFGSHGSFNDFPEANLSLLYRLSSHPPFRSTFCPSQHFELLLIDLSNPFIERNNYLFGRVSPRVRSRRYICKIIAKGSKHFATIS